MKSVLFLILVILICSCNPRVQRLGYSTQKKDYWDCGVAVKKHATISDTLVKIGEINLGDCGSKIYNEETSLAVLRNEGCAADADLVNIIEENKNETNCYKCRAEFYAKKKPNSPTYEPPKQKMTGKQKSELAGTIILGASLTLFLLTHTALLQ